MNLKQLFVNHPLKICGFTYILTILISVSLVKVRIESNVQVLLANTNGQAIDDQNNFNNIWGYSSAMQILIKTSDNSNIINERNLLFFYDVYFAVMNSSVTFNGVRYNFHDVCIKMHHPVYGETCYFHSPTEMFKSRSALIELNSTQNILRQLSKSFVGGFCSQKIDTLQFLGKLNRNGDTFVITSAESMLLQMYYRVRGPDSLTVMTLFDTEYENIVNELAKSLNTNVEHSTFTQNGYRREVHRDIIPSIISCLFGVLAVWTFTCFAIPGSSTKSQIIMATQSLVNCIFALALGIGIVSTAGVAMSPLSLQILPFFIFGIGLDNCYFLSTVFLNQSGDLEEKVEKTLKDGVLTIIISTTELIFTFLLLFNMDLNITNSMIGMAALALFFNATIQIFTFVPVLIILEKQKTNNGESTIVALNTYKTRALELMQKYYVGNLFTNRRFRQRIIFGFCAFTVFTSCFIGLVKQDLSFQESLPDDSSITKFTKQYNNYFGDIETPLVLTVTENINSLKTRQKIVNLSMALSKDTQFLSIRSLVSDLALWSRYYKDTDVLVEGHYNFSAIYASFLSDTAKGGICYKTNVDDLTNNVAIILYVPTNSLSGLHSAYTAIREQLSAHKLGAFVAGPLYPSAMIFSTLTSVYITSIIAIIGTLTKSIKMSILSAVLMGMLQLQIFGLFGMFGIPFNPITAVNSLIAVGIYIDYSAYLTNTLIKCEPNDASLSKHDHITQISMSVTNGFFCSFLSLLFLAFSKFKFVHHYFMYPYLVILLIVWVACLVVYPTAWIEFQHCLNNHYRRKGSIAVPLTENCAD